MPGIPENWIDFLHSRLPFLPAVCEMQTLPARVQARRDQAIPREHLFRFLTNAATLSSEFTKGNLQQLRRPECVIVLANLMPSLLGGSVSQILKCLTAVKVCEELATREVLAVPVCWIGATPQLSPAQRSVILLDSESELHCLRLQNSRQEVLHSDEELHSGQIAQLLSQIETLGRGAFDGDVLGLIRATHLSGATLSSACARLMAELMREWGMIVVDACAPSFGSILDEALAAVRNQAETVLCLLNGHSSGRGEPGYNGAVSGDHLPAFLLQNLVMPVIACIIDLHDLSSCESALRVLDDAGLPRPMVWPQASATILDARSRRILERYNLDIDQLYSGEEEIIEKIKGTRPNSASLKLQSLTLEVQMRMADPGNLIPSSEKLAGATNSCKERIVYQLDKLRSRIDSAVARKESAMSRQIHRICNFLAPNGRIQEREIAAIQIPLRYSRAGMRYLYQKLDILQLEHQLIPMD